MGVELGNILAEKTTARSIRYRLTFHKLRKHVGKPGTPDLVKQGIQEFKRLYPKAEQIFLLVGATDDILMERLSKAYGR